MFLGSGGRGRFETVEEYDVVKKRFAELGEEVHFGRAFGIATQKNDDPQMGMS